MAVRPIAYHANGDVDVVEDGTGHAGVVSLRDQSFLVRQDGTLDQDWLGLTCPVAGCGAVSYHPVGGGCSRGLIQKMFAIKWMRDGQLIGIPVNERGWPTIKARVCSHADAMDGPGSCRITGMSGPNDDPDDMVG